MERFKITCKNVMHITEQPDFLKDFDMISRTYDVLLTLEAFRRILRLRVGLLVLITSICIF